MMKSRRRSDRLTSFSPSWSSAPRARRETDSGKICLRQRSEMTTKGETPPRKSYRSCRQAWGSASMGIRRSGRISCPLENETSFQVSWRISSRDKPCFQASRRTMPSKLLLLFAKTRFRASLSGRLHVFFPT